MADQKPAAQSKIFISYSRKDKEFVKKLNDGLDASGVNAWVDWEGIPLASDWRDDIKRAIQSSDAFVYVISPDSIASKECDKELVLALEYKKKLVPVLYRMPEKDGLQPHEKIRATNWTYLRDGVDDFAATLPKLVEAIHTDLEWVRQNTNLLEDALEWESKNKDSSLLLRGSELDEAERWRTDAATASNRQVVKVQNEFIDASRKAVAQGQRRLLIGITAALIISIGLAIYAVVQSIRATESEQVARQNEKTAVAAEATAYFNQLLAQTEQAKAQKSAATAVAAEAIAKANEQLAVKSENIAMSQRSAAQAQIFQQRAGELDVSTLLAIDSLKRQSSFFRAEEILRQNIARLPRPVGQVDLGQHVTSVEFNSDGSQFVSADWAGYACLWQADPLKQVRCFEHEHWVVSAFYMDDTRLVTAAGQQAFIWNVESGEPVFTYDAPAQITAVALSSDKIWLAVGTENNPNNNELLIVNLVTGKFWGGFEQQGEIVRLEFNPTGKRLAIGTSAGKLSVWPVLTNALIPAPSHRSAIIDLAYSPDGSVLVAGGKDSLARVLDAGSVTPRYPVLGFDDWLEDIAFSSDGAFFVASSDDFRIYVFETASGRELVRMQHQSFATKVAISPNNQWIASSSYDRTVRIWNAVTGDLMREIPLDAFGSVLAFSPDGRYLVVGEDGGRLSAWDLQSLAMRVGYLEFTDLVNEAHFSRDGKWLVLNTDDQKIWRVPADAWQTSSAGNKTGSVLFTTDELTTHLVVSPDSRWVTTNTSGQSYLYGFVKNRTSQLIGPADDRSSLAFSPDSATLAVSAGTIVTLWDVATEKAVDTFNPDSYIPVNALAFSADGDALAVGLEDAFILWDVADKQEVGRLEHAGKIVALAFSPDGNWLASASDNGTTIFWHWQSGAFAQRYTFTQDGQANMLQFSPDSRLLAIAGEEGATYLVQVSTGKEEARIQNSAAVTSVSFSKDGKYLATASRKVVQVWELQALEIVPSELIIQIACSRLLVNLDETQWQTAFPGSDYQILCPGLPVYGK